MAHGVTIVAGIANRCHLLGGGGRSNGWLVESPLDVHVSMNGIVVITHSSAVETGPAIYNQALITEDTHIIIIIRIVGW
jgi:hypothetical protein